MDITTPRFFYTLVKRRAVLGPNDFGLEKDAHAQLCLSSRVWCPFLRPPREGEAPATPNSESWQLPTPFPSGRIHSGLPRLRAAAPPSRCRSSGGPGPSKLSEEWPSGVPRRRIEAGAGPDAAGGVSVAWRGVRAAARSLLCQHRFPSLRLAAPCPPLAGAFARLRASVRVRARPARGGARSRAGSGTPGSRRRGGARGGALCALRGARSSWVRLVSLRSLSSLAVRHHFPELSRRHGTGKAVRPRAPRAFANFGSCVKGAREVRKPEKFRSKWKMPSKSLLDLSHFLFAFPIPFPVSLLLPSKTPEPAWTRGAAVGPPRPRRGRVLCSPGSWGNV